jgi:hypothetical protein
MARGKYTLLAILIALGALFWVTGASYAVDAPVVSAWSDLGTLNPAFQDDVDPAGTTLDDDETPPDTGNPSDEPGVVDNPVTEQPLDTNAQLLMWQAILGFFSTFLISVINRFLPGVTYDDNLKRATIAFVVCFAIGVLDTMVRGVLDLTNLTATVLVIFTSAIAFYGAWFKPAGLASKIEVR